MRIVAALLARAVPQSFASSSKTSSPKPQSQDSMIVKEISQNDGGCVLSNASIWDFGDSTPPEINQDASMPHLVVAGLSAVTNPLLSSNRDHISERCVSFSGSW